MSKAMIHLQRITDGGGQPPELENDGKPNYSVESEPIDWINENAKDHYDFISEICRWHL